MLMYNAYPCKISRYIARFLSKNIKGLLLKKMNKIMLSKTIKIYHATNNETFASLKPLSQ
jgi:hypothetical protein